MRQKLLLDKHQVHSKSELNNTNFGSIIFSEPMAIDISSTQIRHDLQRKQSCHSQLSASVIDFINKNQLYR